MTQELTKAAQQALEALTELLPDKKDPNHGGHDARDVRKWHALVERLRALTQRPAAQTEREAFEAWYCENVNRAVLPDYLPKLETYSSATVANLFSSWKAGAAWLRASQPAPQQATPATPEDMKVYDGIAAGYFADTQQATPDSACKVCQGTGDAPLVTKGESLCNACYGTSETLPQATPPKVVIMSDSAEGPAGHVYVEGRNLTPEEIAQVTGYTIPTPDDSFVVISYQVNDIEFSAETRRVDENTVDIGRVVAFAQATPEPVGEVVYQLQSGDGKWIDQTRASYDYNVKHGNTVRVLYDSPAPGVPAKLPSAYATSNEDGTWRVLLAFDNKDDAEATRRFLHDHGVPPRTMTASDPAPGVPEGFALVPVEPTAAMLHCIVYDQYPQDADEGRKLQRKQLGEPNSEDHVPFKTEFELAVGQYKRMLAAAQAKGADK